MKALLIAIDGYSSCGKSTLARQLARELSFRYVDTGAMYRAVTLYLLRNQIDIHHPEMVSEALSNISISFEVDPSSHEQSILLNGENVEQEIRVNPRVAGAVSEVSAISEVRRFLVKQQQEMGKEKALVMDGRDIGTVVFPNADLKLFVTADSKIRAQRRLDELAEKGQHTTYGEVLANLEKRDHLDTTRDDSPLLQAADAVVIDNTNLTREAQLKQALELVMSRMQQPS